MPRLDSCHGRWLKPGDGDYIEVSEQLHQPIDQALGVVRASTKQDAAKQFAAFVLGPEGQAILESLDISGGVVSSQ